VQKQLLTAQHEAQHKSAMVFFAAAKAAAKSGRRRDGYDRESRQCA
jgi:hypothetical protein